jgi:hypothetical protein
MTTTLTPREGVRTHPALAALPPDPRIQVQVSGPGLIVWRIYDENAGHNTRTHTAYAAGHVDFPVDDVHAMTPAREKAQAEAEAALREVRKLLPALT